MAQPMQPAAATPPMSTTDRPDPLRAGRVTEAAGARRRQRAYIGLGANLGEPRRAIEAAAAALHRLPDTGGVACSGLYRSAPVDADGPDYLNAVVAIDTGLTPLALLDALQAIEVEHGRQRPYRNAPRTLDLDLLLYGDISLDSDRLTLPHPRGHLRAFVLQPLQELWPDGAWPHRGPLQDLIAGLTEQRIERLA